MSSPLSVHWIPTHAGDIAGKHDRDWLREWNPAFVKIVTDAESVPHIEDVPAGARILVRHYPLSEQGHARGFRPEAHIQAASDVALPQTGSQRDNLVAGPGAFAPTPRLGYGLYGTEDVPEQVGAEHAATCDRIARWCEARGAARSRLLFEGLNEPMLWSSEPPEQVARYYAAFLTGLHGYGLHGVCGNFGVGWPGNGGVTDAPVDWSPFAPMFAAMTEGDYLGLHEYWALNGPQQNWKWWAGRFLQCPQHVPILITECGIDTGVTGQYYGGWTHLPGQMTERAHRFVDELYWYWQQCWDDGRVQAFMPFTYDRGSDTWVWFDMRNEDLIREIVLRAGTFPQPTAFAWSVTPPPAAQPAQDFWDAFKAVFGPQCVDVRSRLATNGSYQNRAPGSIKRVIVHHTAAAATTTWSTVARYHVNTKAWPGIAYHLGITPDGGLSYLGGIETIRYHAGDANGDSIGICFAGNYMEDEPTTAELATFAKLLSVIEAYLGRPITVAGHRDVGQTACPGDNLYAALFAPREPEPGGLAPKPEGPVSLPNDEPAATAEKARWWLEECARQFEAGAVERAQAILYSLIALAYRMEKE